MSLQGQLEDLYNIFIHVLFCSFTGMVKDSDRLTKEIVCKLDYEQTSIINLKVGDDHYAYLKNIRENALEQMGRELDGSCRS